MPFPIGNICKRFNTIIQILILIETSAIIFSSPFCLMYYVSFSYKLDFLSMLASPVTIVLISLIYGISLLIYTVCLFVTRIRAPELELDAYMNKRSKSDLERQHLLANEHQLGSVDEQYTKISRARLGPLQSFFVKYIRGHNITVLTLFLFPWALALAITCYYYAPFNPIKIKSIKPYQTLAHWNASNSIQITWNKDKSRDNKLLLFKESWIPTSTDMVNPALWSEITPSTNSNQRYAIFTDLIPGKCYYYYVPSFTALDELNRMCPMATDVRPTIAVIADIESSPYINRVLNERLHNTNPDLTVLLGNMVKDGSQEAEWLLLMQSQGIFNYFQTHPVVALPGFRESKKSVFFPDNPRYFYSLVFSNSQVLSRYNNAHNDTNMETETALNERLRDSTTPEPYSYYTDNDLKYIPEHLHKYYRDEDLLLAQITTVGEYKYYITGNMTIIFLDSMQESKRAHKYDVRLGSFLTVEQINWLVSVLEIEAVQQTAHTVLFVQAPLYSTGEHDGVSLLADLLEPLICKCRISAIITGDSRIYELYHDTETCTAYGITHTFLHVTVGSGGSPPAAMLSLFLGNRRWNSLEYSADFSTENHVFSTSPRTRVYARSGFTYATLTLTEGYALMITAYDIVTGAELNNIQLSVQK